ncbi:MAG: N-acyl amino acid synthase FeeM domain-containing protein, partial [Pseudobdellovibrionaceae bacterium]
DPTESQLRFSKFHALPTTVILVAKWGDDVIGTLSIIPDSALGLPADMTWSLDKYRKNGKVIAEISSLAIKKDFRMRRGRLLMPLCKIMYLYCTKLLKLDGIVIATTMEVEPFYTDILLFKKVVTTTGQEHNLVKGNPSSCCYLELDDKLIESYRKIYSKKPLHRNLHYFFIEYETTNIHLPVQKQCIQSYMIQKNSSQAQIMKDHRSLTHEFTDADKMVIKNLDIAGTFTEPLSSGDIEDGPPRNSPRAEIRAQAWCFFENDRQPILCRIMDISKTGFKMILKKSDLSVNKDDQFILVLDFHGKLIQCKAEVKWVQSQTKVGCHVLEPSQGWDQLMEEIQLEINSNHKVVPLRKRKTA